MDFLSGAFAVDSDANDGMSHISSHLWEFVIDYRWELVLAMFSAIIVIRVILIITIIMDPTANAAPVAPAASAAPVASAAPSDPGSKSAEEKFVETLNCGIVNKKYNYDFTNLKDDGKRFFRGGREYIRPYGWKRIALNVMEKYDDTEWIGGVKEWPVSYHGTKDICAKLIAAGGYDLRKGKRFEYEKGELT